MGIDKIPIGPDLFKEWAGPVWGLRVWRVFFGIVLLGIVGGIGFGGWKAYEEIRRTLATPPPVQVVTRTVTKPVYLPAPQVAVPTPSPSPAQPTKHTKNADTPHSVGSITDNNGIITFGQSGNNTVLRERPDRHITDPIATILLSHMPSKSQEVHTICAVNDREACSLEEEFYDLLIKNGFRVTERTEGIDPDLNGGVRIYTATNDTGAFTKIAIGPNK